MSQDRQFFSILTCKCASFHIELPKMLAECQFFRILTCKCASRHSAVPFFDISTSKSAPNPSDFVHFYLKCASLHSGVQFFVSELYLRAGRFSEPTFRPSRHTNPRKTQHFATFLTFRAGVCSFLLYLLSSASTSLLCFSSSDSASALLFQLSTLSEVRLLNFL